MSNLSELLDNIGDKDTGCIKTVGLVFGALADFSGAIGFVQLAVDTVEGLFSHDSDLQETLNALTASVAQLHNQIASSDKLQRMRDIDEGINPAVGVFAQLPAILSSSPPVSQDFKEAQIQTCLDAALFFADYDDKWQAVWADMSYYSDPWSGTQAPEPGTDGLVFDYIYTLPQFLRAIYIFLTSIGALAPSSLDEYRDALTRCLIRLESIHQTITDGIVGTRLPTANQIGYITPPPEGGAAAWQSDWAGGDMNLYFPYGAVETYSGVSNVRSYWNDFLGYPWDAGDIPDSADRFIKLLKLRIIRQKKAVYDQVGMPIVRFVINELRNLTGQPLLSDMPYGSWSADEVSTILELPSHGPGQILDLPVWLSIESSLKTFLQQTRPIQASMSIPGIQPHQSSLWNGCLQNLCHRDPCTPS